MTETDWSNCIDPAAMMVFVKGRPSDRKLRLFAVACCRRVWHLIPVAAAKTAVQVAERYADGTATEEERQAAWSSAYVLAETQRLEGVDDSWEASDEAAAFAVSAAIGAVALFPADEVAQRADVATSVDGGWLPAGRRAWADVGMTSCSDEQIAQTALLRDIIGNPFRPITLSPAVLVWNDAAVVRLAQATYEERHLPEGTLDNGRLAILADALEEAGCQNADILGHCRSGGDHVRGCWVIDALLGKS